MCLSSRHMSDSAGSTALTGVSWLTHKTSSHVLSFFNLLTASPNGGQYQLKLKECKSTFYQMYWTNRIDYRPKGFVCKRRAVSFPLFVSREGSNLCLTNHSLFAEFPGVLIRHEAIEMVCAHIPQSREPPPNCSVLGASTHAVLLFQTTPYC